MFCDLEGGGAASGSEEEGEKVFNGIVASQWMDLRDNVTVIFGAKDTLAVEDYPRVHCNIRAQTDQ